jgi:hypothetical protein
LRGGTANSAPPPARGGEPRAEPPWAHWDDQKLLDLRLCDLGVRITGTTLEERIMELYLELDARRLRFRPHSWLSDEWFCPDGVPGIAIPFYMAHARLARLELSQMFEVEGGTREWCLRILRHETGHAIENAFRLRRRARRQQLFGKTSTPYPDHYVPRPYSRSFVIHLDDWYAQSHPDEDFAETFAIWLTPDSNWRERYRGWPALKKLEYMDELMGELAGQTPPVTTRQQVEPLSAIRRTLREHYARKRRHYGVDRPHFYDRDLRRLFSEAGEHPQAPSAAAFIARVRKEVRRRVRRWTGVYQYTIDRVIQDVVDRCRELDLRMRLPEEQTKQEFTVLLTVQTMNHLHSGRHRVAL